VQQLAPAAGLCRHSSTPDAAAAATLAVSGTHPQLTQGCCHYRPLHHPRHCANREPTCIAVAAAVLVNQAPRDRHVPHPTQCHLSKLPPIQAGHLQQPHNCSLPGAIASTPSQRRRGSG
jgi:hypothetical protein